MDISLAAIMSIVALLIVVIISCVNEDLNVGFLAIAFAILVGGLWGATTGAKVLSYFPVGLFMILVGVTFLFGMAQTNGTMEKLTAYSIRICKGNTAIVSVDCFLIDYFCSHDWTWQHCRYCSYGSCGDGDCLPYRFVGFSDDSGRCRRSKWRSLLPVCTDRHYLQWYHCQNGPAAWSRS